ncbi:hypothetical protein UlMin_028425 [Ulmus minor]
MSLKQGQKLTWEAPCGHVFVQVLKNEGPKSLYLGLTLALTRSVLYGGLRLGLYEPSKYACDWAFGSTNIFFNIASGGFAGSFTTALTNLIEVLKGLGPAMAKAAALTASQLATYDESNSNFFSLPLEKWKTIFTDKFDYCNIFNALTVYVYFTFEEGNCTLFKLGSEKIIKIGWTFKVYKNFNIKNMISFKKTLRIAYN